MAAPAIPTSGDAVPITAGSSCTVTRPKASMLNATMVTATTEQIRISAKRLRIFSRSEFSLWPGAGGMCLA